MIGIYVYDFSLRQYDGHFERRLLLGEEYTTLQLHHCSRAEVNKFLLVYAILFKYAYFRQYFACCAKEYLTAATYYCQVEVKVSDRTAAVISDVISRSGRHFPARFLW